MKQVFIIYTADANLMHDSKVLKAVCTTKQKAIDLLKPSLQMAAIENFADFSYLNSGQMFADLVQTLTDYNQTQRLSENYMIEAIEVNELN